MIKIIKHKEIYEALFEQMIPSTITPALHNRLHSPIFHHQISSYPPQDRSK